MTTLLLQCGAADLCGPVSTGAVERGHLPWSVAVETQHSNRTTLGSGLLVLPNAVLTDSAFVVNMTGWDGKGELPTIPVGSVSIRWAGSDGRTQVSKVVRLAVHKSNRPNEDFTPRGDVALLELDPIDAVFEAPACLDLSGKVLQQIDTGYTGLIETWSEWGSAFNHSLIGTPYVSVRDCAELLRTTTYDISYSQFCTNWAEGNIDPTVSGAGYLVWAGSRWFVQGLYTSFLTLRQSRVVVATDFREDGLRSWLRKELDGIQKVYSSGTEDMAPSKCEAGVLRPTPECGRLLTTSVEGGKGNDNPRLTSPKEVPWNAIVLHKQEDGKWLQRAGTLIHPYLVLTDSWNLVQKIVLNGTTKVRTTPTRRVVVKYNYPGTSMVGRIHVRERSTAGRLQPFYDLAVIELVTAAFYMPACLPSPVWGGNTQPPLGSASSGVVRLKEDLSMALLNFRTTSHYSSVAPAVEEAHIPGDTFYAETSNRDEEVYPGSAFLVPTNGTWYLRGIHTGNLETDEGGRENVLSFASLDDSAVLHWLVTIMQKVDPHGTVSSKPLVTSVSDSKKAHHSSTANSLAQIAPTTQLYYLLCLMWFPRLTIRLY